MTDRKSPAKTTPQLGRTRMDKINAFALVWMQMYKNHAVTPFDYFENPIFVGDGLRELGFEMDCGESLAKNYPGADLGLRGHDWKKFLEVMDIQSLGNAIFSQCRYFNHWHEAPMLEDDFQWFVESFPRLAALAED